MLSVMAKPALWILGLVYRLVPDWGWSIVVVAVVFYVGGLPAQKRRRRTNQAFKALEPELEQLKRRYLLDKQRLMAEMQALLRERGVSPLSGCLSSLMLSLAHGVFLVSLYAALRTDEALGGASFFWVPALGAPDPFYRLPLLLVGSTIAASLLTRVEVSIKFRLVVWSITLVFLTVCTWLLPAGMVVFWLAERATGWLAWLLRGRPPFDQERGGASGTGMHGGIPRAIAHLPSNWP